MPEGITGAFSSSSQEGNTFSPNPESLVTETALTVEKVQEYLEVLELTKKELPNETWVMDGEERVLNGTTDDVFAGFDEKIEQVRSTWDNQEWTTNKEVAMIPERKTIEQKFADDPEIKKIMLKRYHVPKSSEDRAEKLRKDEGDTNNAWMFFSSASIKANVGGELFEGLEGNFKPWYLNLRHNGAWDDMVQHNLPQVMRVMNVVDAYISKQTGAVHPCAEEQTKKDLRKIVLYLYEKHNIPAYFMGVA